MVKANFKLKMCVVLLGQKDIEHSSLTSHTKIIQITALVILASR